MTAVKEIGKRKLIDCAQTTVLIEVVIVMIVVGTRRFVYERSIGRTRKGMVREERENQATYLHFIGPMEKRSSRLVVSS